MTLKQGAFFYAVFAFLLTVFSEKISAAPPEDGIMRKEIKVFSEIDPSLFRGEQPTEEGLRLLKKYGIRTLINFRHETKSIEWEREKARELGFKYVSLPWRIQARPDSNVMQNFLETVRRKEDAPFFMHCRRGSERTGVAEAVYRYYVQKLPAEEAYQKATEGYPILFFWRPFMKQRYREFLRDLGPQNPPG
ncbi:MAG TPA: tyrosine-protein phosphatase [Candidatus Omnitrophota bacterium]|nr:tyrosine-protein phosphatase [Candidatus Omnitrophota bacterium]